LNPIVKAQSNHKYDAIDFNQIAPEYGTFDDLKQLADELHKDDMQLVLDGVFNHIGFQSDWFQSALNDPQSNYRDWFYFDEKVQNGYVGWWGVANLPELNWDNPEVRDAFLNKDNGIVREYFNYGIDGWRLDVATELGFDYLRMITDAAEQEKADALVIGEVWNYPRDWTKALNAVMNFSIRELMFRFVENKLAGPVFTEQLATQFADADYEALLRSWLLIDNHDTPRLKTLYPEQKQQRLLQIMQMTLPGAPLVYYGVELGMVGGFDPENRAPMRWDLNTEQNEQLRWFKSLVDLRTKLPALKFGDFIPLSTAHAMAFMRTTDKVADSVVVVFNNQEVAVQETLMLRDPRIMNGDQFIDQLSGQVFPSKSGVMTIKIPAQSALILKPDRWLQRSKETGHSPYKHID
jgi:glycosidase